MTSSGRTPPSVTVAQRVTLDRLLLALLAELILSAASWILSLHGQAMRFWPAWLATFVLYQIPYAALLWRLNRRADSRGIAFAIAVSSAALFWEIYSLATTFGDFSSQPTAALRIVVFLLIDVAILLLALKVRKQRGLAGDGPRIAVASAVALVYFMLVHFGVPILDRIS